MHKIIGIVRRLDFLANNVPLSLNLFDIVIPNFCFKLLRLVWIVFSGRFDLKIQSQSRHVK